MLGVEWESSAWLATVDGVYVERSIEHIGNVDERSCIGLVDQRVKFSMKEDVNDELAVSQPRWTSMQIAFDLKVKMDVELKRQNERERERERTTKGNRDESESEWLDNEADDRLSPVGRQ